MTNNNDHLAYARPTNDELCCSLEAAIEDATEWYAEHPRFLDDEIECDEVRPPTVDDLPDYTSDVIDRLAEWVRENERMQTYDGGAQLDFSLPDAETEALRAAVRAYIAATVDLSEAVWQPTGRVLVVRRDGSWEIRGGEE